MGGDERIQTLDLRPMPLAYPFEAERQGKFERGYEQARPRDWIVKRVKKVL